MADYKDIKGTTVSTLTADPPTALAQGDLWYRSDSDVYKMGGKSSAWSSGEAFPWPVVGQGSGGTQTAAWHASGQGESPGPASPTATYWYNGTTWSDQSQASPNNSGYIGSTGTQASGLIAGGTPQGSAAAYWGGSSWTAITGLGQDRRYIAGFGATGTSAVMCGGQKWSPNSASNYVEEWNGTSWTALATMPEAKSASSQGHGTSTTGMVVGGDPKNTINQIFNGTSWGLGTAYPTAIGNQLGCGPNAACLEYGGATPGARTTLTCEYDGSTWTTKGSLTTARSAGGSSKSGSTAASLMWGGTQPGNTAATEEYNEADAIVTVTTS